MKVFYLVNFSGRKTLIDAKLGLKEILSFHKLLYYVNHGAVHMQYGWLCVWS